MWRAIAVAVAVALIAPSTAQAAPPTAAATREAKAHFGQGKALQDLGKWEEAIIEYQAAYKLAPLPQLLFNIAQCYRLKGDKQKAVDSYEAYLAAAPDGGAADEAHEHVATLQLRIEVERAEAASRRAAQEAETARHQAAEAEAARRRAEAEIDARHRHALEEEQHAREEAAAAAAAEREKGKQEEAARQRRVAAAERSGRPVIIAGGVAFGAGLLIGGLAFTIVVDGLNQDRIIQKADADMMWTPEADRAIQQGKKDTQAMIGMWITGGVLAVGGAVTMIVGYTLRARARERVGVALVPSPGGGSVFVGGRF